MSASAHDTHTHIDTDADSDHGLLARATAAAQDYRAMAPDIFAQRRDNWPQWMRHAVTARWISTAFGVPIDHVMITHDPDRRYGDTGEVIGNLITIADPGTGELWRFIPDADGAGWLYLDACPDCDAPSVPVARVATLADLGEYLDTDDSDLAQVLPPEFDGDPAHHDHCPYAPRDA